MSGLVNRIVKAAQSGAVSPMVFDGLVAQSKTYVEELYGSESWQFRHIESLSSLANLPLISIGPEKLADKLFAIAHSIMGMNFGRAEAAMTKAETNRMSDRPRKFDSKSVFVVHGHDHEALTAVADFVRVNGLNPVILKDELNSGKTLLEKFLSNSEVGFAIILLTPDDMGGAKSQNSQSFRARQNVILELGYFIGAIGRDRVAVLYVDGVELPSDIVGLAYISFDSKDVWKKGLKLEFEAAGYA